MIAYAAGPEQNPKRTDQFDRLPFALLDVRGHSRFKHNKGPFERYADRSRPLSMASRPILSVSGAVLMSFPGTSPASILAANSAWISKAKQACFAFFLAIELCRCSEYTFV